MKKALVAILLILSVLSATAQDTLRDPAKVRKNVKIVLGVEAAFYATSMTGLYFAWYTDYPQSPFHFCNDNAEWLQMDKVGHFTTNYIMGSFGYEFLKDAGLDEKTFNLVWRNFWIILHDNR